MYRTIRTKTLYGIVESDKTFIRLRNTAFNLASTIAEENGASEEQCSLLQSQLISQSTTEVLHLLQLHLYVKMIEEQIGGSQSEVF